MIASRAQQSRANKWGRAAGHLLLSTLGFFNPYFARGTPPELRRDLYRDWLLRSDDARAELQRARLYRLRGKVLVVREADDVPSFVDVLIELVNQEHPLTQKPAGGHV